MSFQVLHEVAQRGQPAVDDLVARYRGVERNLAKVPPVRMLRAIPETSGYVARTMLRQWRNDPLPGLPRTRMTPALLAQVAIDESILTLTMGPDRYPHRADYVRVGAEVADALRLFEDRGWLDDPMSYHRDPPPLDAPDIAGAWANLESYELVTWPSEFVPRPEEPGAQRWEGFEANHQAGAWMLRHRDGPRPWIVCIHGFAMGWAFMDFVGFNVAHLHHDLGLNVIGPTLPLHGRRRTGRMSGDQLLDFDLVNTVHGLTQAVWDIRRLLGWIRSTQEPTAVGLYGVSLGAYTGAIVSAFEPDLDAVIAGIPVSDFPAMFRSQSPEVILARSIEHGILGGPAESMHRVVSPLVLEPAVPIDRRFIFAGLGDRMSHPRQAHDLWKHWGEPVISWYPGNHVGYLFSSKVKTFVDEVLTQQELRAR